MHRPDRLKSKSQGTNLLIFTGLDALRRFVEIHQLQQPLVITLPTDQTWALVVAQAVGGVTINAGGPAALSCDMGRITALDEAAARQRDRA